MSYKDTLNLPTTAFPMKANLAQREPKQLARWQEMKLYERLMQERAHAQLFLLHDGPPYANGAIHIGHALNKILKDLVLKSKAMSGYQTPYVPGWDCHGLPIELNVEKKVGKPGVKVSPAEFRQACRDYAKGQVQQQAQAFQRLGVLGDWEVPYLTMNFEYEAGIIQALAKIIQNGHLQQGRKPVHWCVDCQSALAEAEVEYHDKQSFSIDVKFPASDAAALLACFQVQDDDISMVSVVIWTTTPWTLPANQAVAVHADLDYVLVKTSKGEYLVLAQELVESCCERFGVDYEIVGQTQGMNLENLWVQHPFYDRRVPVVLGDHVTVDSGTGVVHTAPAHGREDYEVALKYDLTTDNPVAGNGCYLEDTPLVAGEFVLKANRHIIEILQEKETLLCEHTITHSYPCCWRHKTPLIFRATPQWFVSMTQQGLRDRTMQIIDDVTWLPSWGDVRMQRMLENRPDWCISRQRFWGTPLPLLVHKKTGALHPETDAILEQVVAMVRQRGIDAWFEVSVEELIGDDANDYDKLTDTLDVWFDSGVSHACVLSSRFATTQADIYLEGSDQYRGWFQSSLLTSVAMHDQSPYKTVITHGFTLDGQGRKMSKSLGNIIEPEKVMKSLGADVLRLWVASCDYQAEQAVSEEILKRTSELYRRIRNTARYLLSNLYDFEPSQDQLATHDLLALDRYIVSRAKAVQKEIMDAYENYQFHEVSQKLHHFCTLELGSFYLDVTKDRQYTNPAKGTVRRSCQTAMYLVLEALVRWMAPVLPFTADEVWSFMPGERSDSVLLTTWYEGLFSLDETDKLQHTDWQQLLLLRDEVNKVLEAARAEGQIGAALEAKVTIYADDNWRQQIQKLGNELHFLLICSETHVHDNQSQPSDAQATAIPGLSIVVDKSTDQKCERCWHYCVSVGTDDEHPQLCTRCVSNVAGCGEVRHYV